MDTSFSHELSDAQIVALLLLHLRGTLQTVQPQVPPKSFNVRAVNLFWDHLHKNDFEELIDLLVGTTPQTLSTGNLQSLQVVLHRCGGLAVLLSQPNPFCMRHMSPQQADAFTTACVRFLQECFGLVP
jgi:hypothetical protein